LQEGAEINFMGRRDG